MNTIKGLIIKDLLQLKSYRRTILIFIIIFSLSAFVQKDSSTIVGTLSVMLTLGFGMFAISSFNYDEMAKADRYILTLPITKKEVVISRYFLIIASTIIGAVVGMIGSFLIFYMITKQFLNIEEAISITLGGIFGLSLVESIQIPCIYKYGAEKGRMQIFIVIAIIALIIGGVFLVINQFNMPAIPEGLINSVVAFLPFILIAATVIIYYISYKISYKIYAKKEV